MVDTTDPLALGSSGDANSLSLPAGSSAVSPLMCVDLHYPTMRFVGMQLAEEDLGLNVEVFYPNVSYDKQKWERTYTAKSKLKDGWEVTKDIKVKPERGGKTAGWRLVSLRLTAEDKHEGTWFVDDIYVDPRMK